MTLRTITAVGFFNEFRPCKDYPPERLEELWQGRELNALDILNLDIPLQDRLWGAIRMVDAKTQRLFACDCAERALKREQDAGREQNERSWNAVVVARCYANGEATREELKAACNEASFVASSWAEWAAAWSASVSDRATDNAISRAARSARPLWAQERQWQVDRLKECLEGEE